MAKEPFDGLELHVNQDRPHEELFVLHNTADDEGGFDGSSIEGGRYVMPGIARILADTRMKIHDKDVITMDLSKEEPGDPKARFLGPIVRHTAKAADKVEEAFLKGQKVLSLGGNHVRGFDVIGALRACHTLGIKMGIIWVDAHPDLNTPESTASGHVHGMASAILHGRGPKELLDLLKGAPFIDPHDFIYIGINAIDNPKNDNGTEKEHTELKYLKQLRDLGVKCITMEQMKDARKQDRVPDEVKNAVTELSDRMKASGGKVWVEWDVDSVDVKDMPAAVMSNTDGMSGAQIKDLFKHLGSRCSIDGVGVSELNPKKDIDGKSAQLVAEGVGHLFGVMNPTYAGHMHRARQEMKGEHPEESAKPPSAAPWKSSRLLHFIAATAAGIATAIVGSNLQKPTTEVETGPRVVSNERMDGHFLSQFSYSNFSATASRLRLMVEKGDEKGKESAMNALVEKYMLEYKRAPSPAASSALAELALSEFTTGFTVGTQAGSNELKQAYEEFQKRVHERMKA